MPDLCYNIRKGSDFYLHHKCIVREQIDDIEHYKPLLTSGLYLTKTYAVSFGLKCVPICNFLLNDDNLGKKFNFFSSLKSNSSCGRLLYFFETIFQKLILFPINNVTSIICFFKLYQRPVFFDAICISNSL